jgi:hypothetical protein
MRSFAYIGPHIKNLDNLLNDGDGDTSNNRFQSDVVSIFLNLSAIPDEVVSKIIISEEDFSINIAENMTPILSSKSPSSKFSPGKLSVRDEMFYHYNAYREFLTKMDLS